MSALDVTQSWCTLLKCEEGPKKLAVQLYKVSHYTKPEFSLVT